jgi:hypothetical protein
MFAGLTKKNIKRGHWRILTEQEVNNLKMFNNNTRVSLRNSFFLHYQFLIFYF